MILIVSLTDDDCSRLLDTLIEALYEAEYAEAADAIAVLRRRSIGLHELDDYLSDQEVSPTPRYMAAELSPLIDPSPHQRLSAAIRIIEHLVVDPLEIDAGFPERLRRIDSEPVVRVGEDEPSVVLSDTSASEARAVLSLWQDILSEIRRELPSSGLN